MDNYYDDILENIQSLIQDGKYTEARYVLKTELNMPYIPLDVEEKLHQLDKELRFHESEKRERYDLSLDDLLEMLKGNATQQLLAAEGLLQRNLRDCIPEIKEWFLHDPQPEASALIIEELGKQGIREEFVLHRNDMEFEFYSDDIIPVAQQEGFLYADAYLKKCFLHHPDYYEMARAMLIHEVYIAYPLSYDREDGEGLGKVIEKQIISMMENE